MLTVWFDINKIRKGEVMLRHIVMWKFNEGVNIPRVGEEIIKQFT